MEAQKAIEIIKRMNKGDPAPEQKEALEEAYAALERQIANTPNEMKNIDFRGSIRASFKSGDCPCCGACVDTDDDAKFCTECGQKLNWEN